MKKSYIIIFLVTFLFSESKAQSKDSFTKDDSWKFAAGVTLYSNTDYSGGYIDLTHRPLEFNLRYKISNNHVLRMGLPLVIKENLWGSISYPPNYDEQNSLEDYYKLMLSEDAREYFQMVGNNYSMYGITLGYDYNYSFTPAFSAFAGVDLAYYYSLRRLNFYGITYLKPIDNSSKILMMEYVQENDYFYKYAINPIAGIRYQYQKLLIEVSLGCSFYNLKYTVNKKFNKFNPGENNNTEYSEDLNQPFLGIQQQFVSQLSLYYTL